MVFLSIFANPRDKPSQHNTEDAFAQWLHKAMSCKGNLCLGPRFAWSNPQMGMKSQRQNT